MIDTKDDTSEATQIEMAEDDEIEQIYERKTLLHKIKKKEQSWVQTCCRFCMSLAAMVIFVLMLVQLWSNYGEYIENRVMSPTIVGAGKYTKGFGPDEFVMKMDKWINGTLYLNVTQPKAYIVDIQPPLDYVWKEDCLQLQTNAVEKLHVFVWSL